MSVYVGYIGMEQEGVGVRAYAKSNSIKQLSNVPGEFSTELARLGYSWRLFDMDMNMEQYREPIEDFRNSDFMNELKLFFSDKKSILTTETELNKILSNNLFTFLDKTEIINGKKYHARVIFLYADLSVLALTDKLLYNKWLFVQYWDEDSFYFQTLMDGQLFFCDDFQLFEKDGTLYLEAIGREKKTAVTYCWELTEGKE